MANYKLHFGCRILNPENARLTREKYAEINKKTRHNSFLSNRSCYSNMSIDEANDLYWRIFQHTTLTAYKKEMDFFQEFIKKLSNPQYAKESLEHFIDREKEHRIEREKQFNHFFNINSNDPLKQDFGEKYATLLHDKSIYQSCDEKIKEKYDMLQSSLARIDKYTLSDMLHIMSPRLWQEWKNDDPSNQGFDIPDEWFKEYAMRKAPYYTEEKCKLLQESALRNFDANIRYFNSLDGNKFNNEIDLFLKNHPTFEIVNDLRNYKSTAGVYILILDEYKQIYIGITRNKNGVKGRIQAHWSNTLPLDRLIWGGEKYSPLSIDSFKALDTTRILFEPHPEFSEIATDEKGKPQKGVFMGKECNIWNTGKYLESKEYELINNAFSQEFLCNRCDGGGSSFIEAVISRKGRNLPNNDNK